MREHTLLSKAEGELLTFEQHDAFYIERHPLGALTGHKHMLLKSDCHGAVATPCVYKYNDLGYLLAFSRPKHGLAEVCSQLRLRWVFHLHQFAAAGRRARR